MTQADLDPMYWSGRPMPQALMELADSWAQSRSKSPRSKVGAVLYCVKSGMMTFGYNGLPAGMPDTKRVWDNQNLEDPLNLYNLVQHAEMNCIRKAWQCGNLFNFPTAVLCVTLYPCHHCMKDFIVPSGVKQVWFRDYHRTHKDKPDLATEELARVSGISLRKLGT